MPTGIELSSGVVVGQPKPLEAKYGPYLSVSAALSDVPVALRFKGLTIGIIQAGGAVKEYWFENGTTNADFVEKLGGVRTVNGIAPNSTGNITLTANSVGAVSLLKEVYFTTGPGITQSLFLSEAAPLSDAVDRNVELRVAYYGADGTATLVLPRVSDGAQHGDRIEINFTAPVASPASRQNIFLKIRQFQSTGSGYTSTIVDLATMQHDQTLWLRSYGTSGWYVDEPAHTHDTRYYTKEYIDATFTNIVEVNSFSNLPSIGALTDLYVTTDTQKLYRWATSNMYVEVGATSGVTSVNGLTGAVSITPASIGAALAGHTHSQLLTGSSGTSNFDTFDVRYNNAFGSFIAKSFNSANSHIGVEGFTFSPNQRSGYTIIGTRNGASYLQAGSNSLSIESSNGNPATIKINALENTSGNTLSLPTSAGTLALLSDIPTAGVDNATMAFFHSNHNPPASGQTYYMAFPFDLAPTLTAGARLFRFPYPCVIRGCLLTVNVGGTQAVGASGASTIDLFNNNTSVVTNLISNVTYDTAVSNYVATGLNIPISNVSHDFSIRIVSPTFTTAPAVIRRHVVLFFTL